MATRKLLPLALAAALGVAACQDRTPEAITAAAIPAPSFNKGTGDLSPTGDYIVSFKNGIPADFSARVSELGGSVLFEHAPTGIAVVNGLPAEGARTISGLMGVDALYADAAFKLDAPARVERSEVGDVGIASQENPVTASRYAFQWNMRAIGADKAWAAGKLGSSSVTVAILDTGIDYDARDLAGLVDLTRSVSFIPLDNTITARFFPTRHEINDYNGHGTNVATQVSSKAAALAGVTSKTTLIGVKVLGIDGWSTAGSVLSGILYAADAGADIANMSLGGGFFKAGGGQYLSLINRVFNYAKQRGMLIVVAAGNSALDLDHIPNYYASYCDAPHVICVSAIGPVEASGAVDLPASFTNFGRSAITVAGPGGNYNWPNYIYSQWPWGLHVASFVWSYCAKHTAATNANGDPIFDRNGRPYLDGCEPGVYLTGMVGTSQATPHVAGLAALIMADRGVDAFTAKQLLIKSADDLGQPGADPYFGRGRINVARAVGLE